MNNEEKVLILNKIYELRKKAETELAPEVQNACIIQAEELEAQIMTPTIEIEIINGEEFPFSDVFTVAQFVEQVKLGAFNNYDGSGYYGYEKEHSRLLAIPSEIAKGKINTKFTHVAWFNK